MSCPEKGWMPVPGNIQGQDGQVSQEPDLVEGVSALPCLIAGRLMTFKGLFQAKPFYNSNRNHMFRK